MGWHWFSDPDYWASRLAFQRMLAAIYLIAFLVAVNQSRALIGARGLLPVPKFVARAPFRRAPSVFQLYYSDRFFAAICWLGQHWQPPWWPGPASWSRCGR